MARWLQGPAALELLGQRFDDFTAAAGLPITARRAWLQTWADTYRHYQPWLIVVERPDASLGGVAALAWRSRGGVVDVASMGRGQSDYTCVAALDGDAAAELADGVVDALRTLRRPWRLRVEQMPMGDPVARAVVERLAVAHIEPGDPSPVVALDPSRPPDEHMSTRMRRNLRTTDNRLRREGVRVEYVHETEPAAIGPWLADIEGAWRARDRAVGRASGADDRTSFAFFLAGVSRLAQRGEIEVTLLLFDGELAGFAVCFLDGRSYRVWVPRIAPRFGVYSPGHLVTRELLRRAMEWGCSELDWMRGDEPYKRQTATGAREHQHLLAWSSAALRAATEGARAARRSAAARRLERAERAERAEQTPG
jgi:CelD/BcsL family acetyltransferase involved in cellulose biosynthesis